MFISSDPKNKVYKDLLDLAFSVCSRFILVVRKDINISRNAKSVLESLAPFLIEAKEQFEWPGTKYFGEKPATVYYFKTDEKAKRILLEASNSLHTWVQPHLPEDLSFIKNQEPWLINTSHETESFIITEDTEEIEKISKIENLLIRH